MLRRRVLGLLTAVPLALAKAADPQSLRGKLVQLPDGTPVIESAGGKRTFPSGDPDTNGVLKDKRLANMDVELLGHFEKPEHFEVDPIHTRSIFVHQNGRRLVVTYWCDVCAIRTYTPGICWCCQKETDLDLREPDAN